jgi:hypothetical protein
MPQASHPLEQEINRLTSTRGLDAAEQDDDPEVGSGELALSGQEGLSDVPFFPLVGLLVDGVADLGGFKHACRSPRSRTASKTS